ncbi:MAG: ABC transporter permease [Firmicutes bacterium]|nr:ABC transporter permease [Bacillota bacterium]
MDQNTSVRHSGRKFQWALRGRVTILFVLVLFVVFFGVTARGFFTKISLENIMVSTALFLLLSLGETYVMISGGIDLSVSSMLALSGMVSGVYISSTYHGTGPAIGITLIALALSLVLGLAGGTFNGLIIANLKLNPLIVTLGTWGVFYGGAELIANGSPVGNLTPFSYVLGNGGPLVGWVVWITLAFVIAYAWIARRTRFGRYIFAVGANREAVRRAGVNLKRQSVGVYALAGLGAGAAGFLSMAHFQTASPVAGSDYLLIAVAAVIIGGTPLTGGEGSIWGTVVGALIISVLENGFVMLNISAFWQLVAVGLTTILAVYFDEIQRHFQIAQAARRNTA